MPGFAGTRFFTLAMWTACLGAALVLGGLAAAPKARAQSAPAAGSEHDNEIFGSPDSSDTANTPKAPAEETSPAPATRPSERPSEEDMFGAPATAAPERPEPGQISSDAATLVDRVLNKEDILAIGGLVYLRSTYSYARDEKAGQAPFRSPALFDAYGDARPSDRVRIYTRGRFRFDFSSPANATTTTNSLGQPTATPSSAALDQLWLKFDMERTVFVTVGKQPLKWGSGRFWNPTDFLNPQRRDPLAAFDERLGVSLVKFQLPLEQRGVNLYAIADLEGAQSPEEVGGAVRAEVVLGKTESALSASVRKDRPTILGADFSGAIWDFDLRVEGAFLHNDPSAYYTGKLDFARLQTPTLISRKGDWIPQIVTGLEYAFNYSDEDSMSIGAEYFYNDAGYDDPSIYPWLLFQGAFRPLYNGKHYAGLYSFLAGPGSWNDTTFIGSVLTNVSDHSYLARFDYRVLVLTYINIDTFVNYHFGDNGEFNLGIRVPPIPVVPQLAKGFMVAQPRVDAGVGLRVAF